VKSILFVIPTLRLGGAEKALVSLLKCLNKDLFNVDLFLFEGGGVLQKEIPEWVNIIEADEVTRAMTLEARFYLKKLFKDGYIKAALSRLWMSVANKFGFNLFSWKNVSKYIPSVGKEYDVAIGFLEGAADFFVLDKVQSKSKIGWIHTDMSKRDFMIQEIEYYNRFDHIITISEKCKNAVIDAMPGIENKISVIENIVIPEEIVSKSNEETEIKWNDCFNILTVGRLEYDKGIDIGAMAAKELKNKNIKFEWHILGYGSQEEKIRKVISDNGIQDVYKLDGMASNPYPYMKKADIIVQPSRNEGKSIVLDEAKILGKAIVVTNYSSVKDQIIDGVTGIIVDTDPKKIADGVVMLFRDTALRQSLENNCRLEKANRYMIINKLNDIIGVS